MRAHVLTFRYSASLGGFDTRALREFTRDKELLSFHEHLFTVHGTPHLLCVFTYETAVVSPNVLEEARALRAQPAPDGRRAPIPAGADPPRGKRRQGAQDPTSGLDERERALFNTLRDWRARRATEEGVPPYLVFTNRHLLELIARRPDSPTALGNLHGIGPGKVERYGREMLALLSDGTPPDAAQDAGAGERAPAMADAEEPVATAAEPAADANDLAEARP